MSTSSTTGSATVSTMLCANCGGAIDAPSEFTGRRCTCSRPPHKEGAAPPPMTDAQASAVGHKFCCVCGADVTHAKRMKDHEGRYWCYECGAADQMKKGQALTLRCPNCERNFPPAKMVKVNADYVCQECVEKAGGKVRVKRSARRAARRATASDAARETTTRFTHGDTDYGQLMKLIVSFIVTIVLGTAALMGMHYLGLL